MENQFLVFTYDCYYPAGGMGDLKESFDTLLEVEEYLKNSSYDSFDVYDRINNVTVTLDIKL